mmetsp:Transcript_69542/g.197068  ORF Transcript_69542/g.197068 Transcript_69542/m.197068 type:complete len:243 (-) Transcript_69542:1204-1932(-)
MTSSSRTPNRKLLTLAFSWFSQSLHSSFSGVSKGGSLKLLPCSFSCWKQKQDILRLFLWLCPMACARSAAAQGTGSSHALSTWTRTWPLFFAGSRFRIRSHSSSGRKEEAEAGWPSQRKAARRSDSCCAGCWTSMQSTCRGSASSTASQSPPCPAPAWAGSAQAGDCQQVLRLPSKTGWLAAPATHSMPPWLRTCRIVPSWSRLQLSSKDMCSSQTCRQVSPPASPPTPPSTQSVPCGTVTS